MHRECAKSPYDASPFSPERIVPARRRNRRSRLLNELSLRRLFLVAIAFCGFGGALLFLLVQIQRPGTASSAKSPPVDTTPGAEQSVALADLPGSASTPSDISASANAASAEKPDDADWMAIPKTLLPPRPETVATVPMATHVPSFHQPMHELTGTVTTVTEHDIRPGKSGKISHLHPDFRVGGYVVEGETLFSVGGLPHHAPVDGVLRSVDLESGETVNKGQRGCRLASLEDLEIRAPYPPSLAPLVTNRHPTVAIDMAEAEFLGHVIGVTNGAVRVSMRRPHHQADVRPDHLFKESATLFIRSPVRQGPEPVDEKKKAEEDLAGDEPDDPATSVSGGT